MDVNLIDLVEEYKGDESKCRAYLERYRWPEGKKCPRCGSDKTSRAMKNGHNYNCDVCHYQFTVTAGTIFHNSHLPLWKWFLAVYLMTESKKGMSANQLKRTLKINYKTAWYLCHRIRRAMEENTGEKPKLKGIVEVDETYVGGKYDSRVKRGKYEKQAVVGLLQRNGTFEAKAIRTPSKSVLTGIVKDRVNKDATIMTDELPAYKSLDKTFHHESVCHSAEEWVRGKVHTNGVENAWSLFKRSVIWSFHHVSEKHIDRYLNEFDWRFNGRENPYLFRDTLIRLLNAPKMEFKELIQKTT
jgi:transposase-like protein